MHLNPHSRKSRIYYVPSWRQRRAGQFGVGISSKLPASDSAIHGGPVPIEAGRFQDCLFGNQSDSSAFCFSKMSPECILSQLAEKKDNLFSFLSGANSGLSNLALELQASFQQRIVTLIVGLRPWR